RIRTIDDQMCNAMRYGVRLPGAGARNDEERRARGFRSRSNAVLDRESLLAIELAEIEMAGIDASANMHRTNVRREAYHDRWGNCPTAHRISPGGLVGALVDWKNWRS